MSRILLAMILASMSAAAMAVDSDREVLTRIVHYGDLDLTRQPGADQLYSRIRSAAKLVCEPFNRHSLNALPQAHQCEKQAIARALADVNVPLLANNQTIKSRTGRP